MKGTTRTGASLFLMELLLGILIFSLAASACVRIFAASSQSAHHSEAYLNAVTIAQNAAEKLKNGESLPEESVEGNGQYRLTLQKTPTADGLTDAVATVSNQAGQTLFALSFTYEEVLS